ncbi:MAG: hypothetical protein ACYC5Q_10635 [Thermoleophilia bacterium]
MPRDARAYLAGEACDAITLALDGLDLEALKKSPVHQALTGQL